MNVYEEQVLVPMHGEHPVELGLAQADSWRDAVGVGHDNPNKSETIRGFSLTAEQRADLIAFLQSLTDEELLHDPGFSNPWVGGR